MSAETEDSQSTGGLLILRERQRPSVGARAGMRTVMVAAAAVVGVAAGHFPEKDRTAAGYNDGFAVGFKTACNLEPVAVEGEWHNSLYSKGYAAGVTDGTLVCLADQ
jgi:hypothetical protein